MSLDWLLDTTKLILSQVTTIEEVFFVGSIRVIELLLHKL